MPCAPSAKLSTINVRIGTTAGSEESRKRAWTQVAPAPETQNERHGRGRVLSAHQEHRHRGGATKAHGERPGVAARTDRGLHRGRDGEAARKQGVGGAEGADGAPHLRTVTPQKRPAGPPTEGGPEDDPIRPAA